MRAATHAARVLAFVSLASLCACSPKSTEILVSPAQLRQKASCVAVIGFANDTKTTGAAEGFTEQLTTGLRSAGFQVMDRTEAGRLLSFHRIYVEDIADEEEAAALGDLLGVEAVIYGTVKRYGWEPTDGPGLAAAVEVEMSMVDVENAKTLMRARVRGDGRRSFGPRPAPLFAAAADASDMLVTDLTRELSPTDAPLKNEPCWKLQADTVLATLAPVPTATPSVAPTPVTTPAAVQLTASQKALLTKMSAGGKFTLEGVEFTGMSEQLATTSSAPLSDLATVLKANPEARIEVLGYVDALDKEAAELSTRRAQAVVAKVIAFGAGKAQLEATGKGGADPRMPSFTEITRARNRRIEVLVTKPPAAPAAPEKPRIKIVAAPGGQLNALQLLAKLKGDEAFDLDKRVSQTRTKRPTTIYYRPGQRDAAVAIAKVLGNKPRARASNKLPSGIDVYVVVGAPGESP